MGKDGKIQKVVIISWCDECPYHVCYGPDEAECKEMSMPVKYGSDRPFPKWCPLEDYND